MNAFYILWIIIKKLSGYRISQHYFTSDSLFPPCGAPYKTNILFFIYFIFHIYFREHWIILLPIPLIVSGT